MLKICNVSKFREQRLVLDQISLEIKQGEFFSLLGPSGCGKTTLLRSVAGLEAISAGEIFYKEHSILSKQHPSIPLVFQNYALFPNMSVYENVAFGLRAQKNSDALIRDRVDTLLQMVKLNGFEHRRPRELSGGQQQRVAIARALALGREIILLDEPMSSLDGQLRKEMQLELKSLQRRLGTTFIYVTHDQEEALTLSDRMAIMNQGKILQVGVPQQIYEAPSSLFVARFIGEINIFKAHGTSSGLAQVFWGTGSTEVVCPKSFQGDWSLCVRPEKVRINGTPLENSVTGKVQEILYLGRDVKIVIHHQGSTLVARVQEIAGLKIGDEVRVSWSLKDSLFFEET